MYAKLICTCVKILYTYFTVYLQEFSNTVLRFSMRKRKFNVNAKGFSKINLAYLAYCSNLVYRTKEEIKNELTEQGFNLERDNYFFSDEETDTQCFIAGDKNKIIIAFRGTEGKLADWKTNMRFSKGFWPARKSFGRIHNGFNNAIKSIWPNIQKELIQLYTHNQSIWLTGHSLGGALTTLAAVSLKFQNPKIECNGIYTFGQPRLGDYMFSMQFNFFFKRKCFRVVNNYDVITRIPPQLFGYRHVGTLIYFDIHGKLCKDVGLVWWAKFRDGLQGGRFENLFNLSKEGLRDHNRKVYLELSEKV